MAKKMPSGLPKAGTTFGKLSPDQQALFLAGFIEALSNVAPSFWDDMPERLEKYKKTHAKEIAARDAEQKAANQRAEFELKARYGTSWDEYVANYLVAFHAGRIRMPNILDNASPENELIWAFHWSVVNNFPNDLRKIAEAVRRVHRKAEGEGTTFKVKPAKPIHAEVASVPAGGTLSVKTREIIETARELGARRNEAGGLAGYSERNVRRIRAALGMKPAKRGRPRKRPK
jgi:hypothetical protein